MSGDTSIATAVSLFHTAPGSIVTGWTSGEAEYDYERPIKTLPSGHSFAGSSEVNRCVHVKGDVCFRTVLADAWQMYLLFVIVVVDRSPEWAKLNRL